MGQTLPTIAVKRFTAAEQDQIKATYQVLCQRSGTTKINMPSFTRYWADYVDPIVADRLWLIFDTKYDGFVDFEEWAVGLSTTLRGNKDDRMKLLGNIFDIDGHGYVIESSLRKLFSTNLFAARNIIKPHDWEAYESHQAQATSSDEILYVKALYDYTGSNDLELSFKEGTVLQLLEKVDDHWWWCDLNDVQGYVPTTYVQQVKPPSSQKPKQSKFQTVKRGAELEALLFGLLKLSNQSLGGKIPKDSFLQWALEHEMDLCFNALEKVDLRAPLEKDQRNSADSATNAPAPPIPGGKPLITAFNTSASSPSLASNQVASANLGAPPSGSAIAPPAIQNNQSPEIQTSSPNEPALKSQDIPATALRPSSEDVSAALSPELALILRAAGIADKELEEPAMAKFIEYFIEKHAPKDPNAPAQQLKPKTTGKKPGSARRRPLPATPSENSTTTPIPTVIITPDNTPSSEPKGQNPSLQEQIKAGKRLKPFKPKTNLTTLSKKDLTGLGLLLRVQIDNRRNYMAEDSGADSDENSDFDD